ncbi:PAS domain-containing sensor histidine kinase [Gracilimonas tropica]|uniref:PAS domain-containing sensor histidine kinase n=1 Tax=Gracilimonas tropica TaxID=454600 RepID=UPI000369FB32|nr:PAS domain-containing sensor histidine kinase [Gracilimonas tropica]
MDAYWRWNTQEDLFEIGAPFWHDLYRHFDHCFISEDQAKSFMYTSEIVRIKKAINNALVRKTGLPFEIQTNHQLNESPATVTFRWKGQRITAEEPLVIGSVTSPVFRKPQKLQLPNHPEFYQQLMDSLPDSVFFKDLESRFIAINKACAKKLGLKSTDEAIGKTDFDFFNLSHAQEAFEDEQKIIETGEPIIHKTEKEVYAEKDKPTTWTSTSKLPLYDDQNTIIGTFGIATDVTEQKRALRQNERLRTQLQAVFDTDPNMIFMKNREGEYLFVNQSTADFYQMEKSEIIGKTDKDLGLSPSMAKLFLETDRFVIDHNETVYTPEDKTTNPAGEEIWNKSIKIPFQHHQSGETVALTIVTDITKLKNRELELSETLDIISQQNKRLKNFAHIVSHNLRNHSGSISMLIECFKGEDSQDERKQLFDHLCIASERLKETIKDLNEIIDEQYKSAKIEREVNLVEFIKKTKEVLTTEIDSNDAKLIVQVPKNFTFSYNPVYLESILLNFFSNAIKYRHPDRSPIVEVNAYEKDDHIWLEISDNGKGIDLQKHGDDLFGMYKTFHDNDDAKGIGLFITKNQIESMGGHIEVKSTPGEGTKFILCLT